MKRHFRIATYFLLGTFVVTMITTGIFIAVHGNQTVAQDKRLVAERDKLFAHTLAQGIRVYVSSSAASIDQLAGALGAQGMAPETLKTLVDNAAQSNSAFFGVSVADLNGKIVYGDFPAGKTEKERDLTGIDVADRVYYKEAIASRKEVISDAITARVAGAPPTIVIAEPIFDAQKNLRGVAIGGLSLDALYQIAEAALGSEYAIPVVVDKQGQVIVHSDRRLIAEHALLGAFEPAKRALRGEEGFLDSFVDTDGKTRSAAYAPISQLGWAVWVAQDTSQFAVAEQRVLAASILWFLATVLGAFAAFFFIAKVIFHPLDKVARDAIAICEENDFSRKIELRGGFHSHEVVSLTESFNTLIDKVRKTYDEQKESLQIKTQFLTVATHAFRTPLTVLRWTLASLMEDTRNFSDDQKVQLAELNESSQRLLLGFENLFTALEIEEKTARVEYKEVELSEVVAAAIRKLRPLAERNAIEIRVKASGSSKLAGDPLKLQTVAEVLLSNAIFYNRQGGIIDIDIKKQNDVVVLTIVDSGIGVLRDEQPHLFEAFFRGRQGALKYTDGTGLGLYIAKAFVELHRGTIEINTTEGEGAIVTVRLPQRISLLKLA